MTVALSPASGAIEKDPEDPGPDRRPTFEVEPPHHTEPRLLDDVGRCLGTSHEEAGHAQHRATMPVDEGQERSFIAGPERGEQPTLVLVLVRVGRCDLEVGHQPVARRSEPNTPELAEIHVRRRIRGTLPGDPEPA